MQNLGDDVCWVESNRCLTFPIDQGFVNGGVGAESWSKVSLATRELATVFSVTFFFVTIIGQLIKAPPPPNGKCLGTSLL